jgi:hypothetical protein
LSGIISPQIDLSRFIELETTERIVSITPTFPGPLGAITFGAAFTVPQNEFWIVHQFGVELAFVGGGVAATVYPGIFPTAGPNPTTIAVGQSQSRVASAAAFGWLQCRAEREFIVQPGYQLRAVVTDNPSGAALDFATAQALISRYRL